MSVRNLIILNNPAHWRFDIEEVEVVAARDYLAQPRYAGLKNARVFNLCRSYRYQSVGYYVSLLAAARGHRAIPSVTTMQDFRSQTIVRTLAEDIDALIQKSFARLSESTEEIRGGGQPAECILRVYHAGGLQPASRI